MSFDTNGTTLKIYENFTTIRVLDITISMDLRQCRQCSKFLYPIFGYENLENFSDEEYDDYNYQYTIDEDDPAGKYTQDGNDGGADG